MKVDISFNVQNGVRAADLIKDFTKVREISSVYSVKQLAMELGFEILVWCSDIPG